MLLCLLMTYPDAITLQLKEKINHELAIVGSKSLTNRALMVAALAQGTSVLEHALIAQDSQVMLQALQNLGFAISSQGTTFQVTGQGGRIPAQQACLDLQLSGTSIRFLTALVSLGTGDYRLDGTARMRQRPIQDLLEALQPLGVQSRSQAGCPPVDIEATGLRGGSTRIAGDSSSQYLSALLMVAPYATEAVDIQVTGVLQSKPFVDLTLKLMEDFGVTVQRDGYKHFRVTPQRYQARHYAIEGDATAAGYFWAAAALTGGRVNVTNVGKETQQGDKRFADVLAQMGCTVNWRAESCEVIAPADGILQGGVFNFNDIPDQAQTMAVVALFAASPVRLEHIHNLRIKETDRLHALATELRKFGASVEEGEDYIVIEPAQNYHQAVAVDTYGDHRMAMAFALAGLRLANITIRNPACVAKTFPDFFARWEQL